MDSTPCIQGEQWTVDMDSTPWIQGEQWTVDMDSPHCIQVEQWKVTNTFFNLYTYSFTVYKNLAAHWF